MKKPAMTMYVCDLCSTEATMRAEAGSPPGWTPLVFEPVDRTFVEKHVCRACSTKIIDYMYKQECS